MSNNPDPQRGRRSPRRPARASSHTPTSVCAAPSQCDDITVYHARTKIARVTLRWSRHPHQLPERPSSPRRPRGILGSTPHPPEPASPSPPGRTGNSTTGPRIAIDWTSRPGYAVMPKDAVTPDKRRTIRWTDVYMGPITFQILDRAAFHSTIDVLREIHTTAAAVCLDGKRFRKDPTERLLPPQAVIHSRRQGPHLSTAGGAAPRACPRHRRSMHP